MTWWVSIDPGLDCVGWVLWEGSDLYCCGISRREGKTGGGKDQGPKVWKAHAQNITNQVAGLQLSHIVTEMPRIYPGSPVNPAGLLQVAAVAGAICALVNAPVGITYLPADWKGKRKKEQTTPEILEELSEPELVMVRAATGPASLLHNMYDAIGIGLWHQGRIKWKECPPPSRAPRRKKRAKRSSTRKGTSPGKRTRKPTKRG